MGSPIFYPVFRSPGCLNFETVSSLRELPPFILSAYMQEGIYSPIAS